MSFVNTIKKQLRSLTPSEIAMAELIEAELAKLEAESAREYAEAHVRYNTVRIARLRAYLSEVACPTL